jgi:hypothetical protein
MGTHLEDQLLVTWLGKNNLIFSLPIELFRLYQQLEQGLLAQNLDFYSTY